MSDWWSKSVGEPWWKKANWYDQQMPPPHGVVPIEELLPPGQDDPDEILRGLDRADSYESLADFVRLAWHVVEPDKPFVNGYHVDAVCEHLQAVHDGQITRLLINVPPGTSKSLLTNVFFPAWEWGPRGRPGLRYVCFSYSSSLTHRDSRRCRDLVGSQWFQERWPHVKIGRDQKDNEGYFENTRKGWRLATMVGGVGTGLRGDRVLLDDPHNVKDGESDAKRGTTVKWARESMPTRMNDPRFSAIVCIMQRVHGGDCSAVFEREGWATLRLPMEFEKTYRCFSVVVPKWRKVEPQQVVCVVEEGKPSRFVTPAEAQELVDSGKLPEGTNTEGELLYPQDWRTKEDELLWPEYMTAEVVKRDKSIMGPYAVAAQFQQRPTPRSGGMFKREDFEIVDASPAGGQLVRAYDLAATEGEDAKATVGLRMRKVDDVYYIEDMLKVKELPGKRNQAMKNIRTQDGLFCHISIPQDPAQAGKSQAMDFVKILGKGGYTVRTSPESGDKITRADPVAAQSYMGNIKLVKGKWNTEFLDIICQFPFGTFDDEVDAMSRGFMYLNMKVEKKEPVAPRIVRFGAR